MALAMVRPYQHPKTKVWWIRKVVPEAMRAIVGQRELKASLRTKDPEVAKVAMRPVLDRWDALLGSAKAKAAGELRALSTREIAAVLGVAYRENARKYDDDPGTADAWDQRGSYYADMFVQTDEHDYGLREFISDKFIRSEVQGIFEAQGIAADAKSLEEATETWAREQIRFASEMEKRAKGDWSTTLGVERFPEVTTASPVPSDAPTVPIQSLVAQWGAEGGKTGKALYDRERTAAAFIAFLGHDDAAKVTADDAVRWKEKRLADGRSTKTVANDLNELSPIWTWARRNRKLTFVENPFKGIAPLKKATSLRARGPYEPQEARRLLEAARGQTGVLRWLPWLLCFTGARLGEIVQSAKEDIAPVQGVPGAFALHIHENGPGRSLKTPQSRRYVPLHPALIEEGLLEYLAGLPKGSPLFPKVGLDKFRTFKGRAGTAHSRWVRKTVGIEDVSKDPAHAWRHLFEDRGRQAGVPQNVTDALMGHKNAANESEGYGRGFGFMPETTLIHVARMKNPLESEA